MDSITDEKYTLIPPSPGDAAAVLEMQRLWREAGGRMNPGLLRRLDGDYAAWLALLDDSRAGRLAGEVPQSFFLMKSAAGKLCGASAVRHYLNETNSIDGGHIAYGIAPALRGRGLGRLILSLTLEKCREMGIDRALVTCDSDNILSQRVILANGGILENETTDEDGVPIRRYWISLS